MKRYSRAVSACELLLGTFIVIGHNVFHIVPNEVPILLVLGLLSIRLRDGGWSAMGFKRPARWGPIVLIAAGAAALRIALGEFVIDPLTGLSGPPPSLPQEQRRLPGTSR